MQEKTRPINRLHKVLEDANIKLGSVATDILGASGRAMLERLIEGEQDPVQRADLAPRPWRGKIPELQKALEGHLTEHHRFFRKLLGKQLGQQEALIAELDDKIEEHTRPFAAEIERLDSVPGVRSPGGRGGAGGSGSGHEAVSNPSPGGRLGGEVSGTKKAPGNGGGGALRRAIAG